MNSFETAFENSMSSNCILRHIWDSSQNNSEQALELQCNSVRFLKQSFALGNNAKFWIIGGE